MNKNSLVKKDSMENDHSSFWNTAHSFGHIIVDTREQKPLWCHEGPKVIKMKLDEGDYTTTKLYGLAHAERKSGSDLYGSIIGEHKRFKKEIERAAASNISLAIFVECPREAFFRKRFYGGFMLKTPTATLRKIVSTMEDKYNIDFFFNADRHEMRENILMWFDWQMQLVGK